MPSDGRAGSTPARGTRAGHGAIRVPLFVIQTHIFCTVYMGKSWENAHKACICRKKVLLLYRPNRLSMKKFVLLVSLVALCMACESPFNTQPIGQSTEKPEAVTNDFTMLKACIGKSQNEAVLLLTQRGFVAGEDGKFRKTENGVTKEVYYSAANVSLVARNNDFKVLKSTFIEYLKQIRKSAVYANLVRSTYSFSLGWTTGNQWFNSPEALIAALDTVTAPVDKGMDATFYGNDCYATIYELYLDPSLGGVYLELHNLRVGQPSDDFTESDLTDADLQKHILISKVDYLTYRYKGFYALNVTDKQNAGEQIPIIAAYHAPCDFGDIKLYYRNTSNLLMDGTIIWMGCGVLAFPQGFRAGLPLTQGLPYPGTEHFARMNEDGQYATRADEEETRHLWETLSRQKEFQHYYGNSDKKVAVYLYRPSVGMGSPYDWYYLIFTEQ